ncbi:MAG: UDP-glucose 4-epimerase [Flammeovirgaceae bacterium]|nr:UDP-glucose 4-epimerase [Flammeovirgaceae bacterium]MBR10972.1 UDP-glucose 4-epimerase [Rickettsiales bacterium]HCX21710.1 DUF779 domain-containing protein [Cytophagales bacterium]|tara:strand:- start:3035 stop:3403 length:369 start_codon:yes stop_codon:yes gene_type:complete
MTERIGITKAASAAIEDLKGRYGDLMFHQSGGCCDGSSPMCFENGDFKVGESDVLLDHVDGCPFYMSKDQYEYWKHTHLTLDITKGRGSSFSLEIPMGIRFLIRFRLLTDEELAALKEEGRF